MGHMMAAVAATVMILCPFTPGYPRVKKELETMLGTELEGIPSSDIGVYNGYPVVSQRFSTFRRRRHFKKVILPRSRE